MFLPKMVDMAETPDEVKKDLAEVTAMPAAAPPNAPRYPYGLCLRLSEKELKKLGVDIDTELPKVGEGVHLCAFAKVTAVSENERVTPDGTKEKCCSVELQICELGVPPGSPAEAAEERSEGQRQAMYGEDDAEEAEEDE